MSGQRGKFDYDGCNVVSGPSVRGLGQRILIVGPHTAAAVDDDDDCCRGGGGLCPPPFRSVLFRRMPLVNVVKIADVG